MVDFYFFGNLVFGGKFVVGFVVFIGNLLYECLCDFLILVFGGDVCYGVFLICFCIIKVGCWIWFG